MLLFWALSINSVISHRPRLATTLFQYLQSWTKRLGQLVIYTWSVHSPNIPLPPWTVLGVTGQKRLIVNWRSLTHFLRKRGGGKRSVPDPFGQDCRVWANKEPMWEGQSIGTYANNANNAVFIFIFIETMCCAIKWSFDHIFTLISPVF